MIAWWFFKVSICRKGKGKFLGIEVGRFLKSVYIIGIEGLIQLVLNEGHKLFNLIDLCLVDVSEGGDGPVGLNYFTLLDVLKPRLYHLLTNFNFHS